MHACVSVCVSIDTCHTLFPSSPASPQLSSSLLFTSAILCSVQQSSCLHLRVSSAQTHCTHRHLWPSPFCFCGGMWYMLLDSAVFKWNVTFKVHFYCYTLAVVLKDCFRTSLWLHHSLYLFPFAKESGWIMLSCSWNGLLWGLTGRMSDRNEAKIAKGPWENRVYEKIW